MPVRAPNSGIMAHVPRGLSPRGAIDSMCTARASPFSAPATMIGPFCGLTNGIVSVALGQVGLGVDHAAEGVARLDRHAIARLDLQDRRRVRAHREVERALALLGQLVGRRPPDRRRRPVGP